MRICVMVLSCELTHFRQNSRAGTPQTNGGTNNGGGGRVITRYLSENLQF